MILFNTYLILNFLQFNLWQADRLRLINRQTFNIISNSFISRICSIKLHYCMRRRPSTTPRGLFKLHSILKRWSRHISFIIKCLIYFSLSSDYIAWITTTPLHLDALCNDHCHWMCTKMHMIPEATK